MKQEFSYIADLKNLFQSSSPSLTLGIGDDAALLRLGEGGLLAVSKDLLIEDIHFKRAWTTPEDLGWKALAVNLSDLAAMGATPVAGLLGFGFPRDVEDSWAQRLAHGVSDCSKTNSIPIVGGDTCRSAGPVLLSVTVLGRTSNQPLLRSGAKPGDALYVSRPLGGSAGGLAWLSAHGVPTEKDLVEYPSLAGLIAAHHHPLPEMELGLWLAEKGWSGCCIDVSDGLAQDLGHILEESQVGVEVELARIPIAPELVAMEKILQVNALDLALHGGEDYALLFTVEKGRVEAFEKALAEIRYGRKSVRIGRILAESGAWAVDEMGQRQALVLSGFDHFSHSK